MCVRVDRPAGSVTGPTRIEGRLFLLSACVRVWGALWQEDRKCMNFDRKEKMNGQKERWWEGGKRESEVSERVNGVEMMEGVEE